MLKFVAVVPVFPFLCITRFPSLEPIGTYFNIQSSDTISFLINLISVKEEMFNNFADLLLVFLNFKENASEMQLLLLESALGFFSVWGSLV